MLITKYGDRYDGLFLNGVRQGEGVQKYFNGDIYEGLWRNDRWHEFGCFRWADGTEYLGEFKDGIFIGKGKLITTNP